MSCDRDAAALSATRLNSENMVSFGRSCEDRFGTPLAKQLRKCQSTNLEGSPSTFWAKGWQSFWDSMVTREPIATSDFPDFLNPGIHETHSVEPAGDPFAAGWRLGRGRWGRARLSELANGKVQLPP